LLNDASEIIHRLSGQSDAWTGITLELPTVPPDVTIPVIEVFLK